MLDNMAIGTMMLNAGGGIDAVENRMRAIESRIASLQKMTASATAPVKAFSTFLQPGAGVEVTGTVNEKARALRPLIEEISQRHGVDQDLVNAVVRQESGFNPGARSKAGASGLMQLMPGTAKTLGVNDTRDPVQNLEGGVRHLKNLLTHYNGNIPLALAAYNAGMGAVSKYGGVPPYTETRNYVRNILSQYLRTKNRNV